MRHHRRRHRRLNCLCHFLLPHRLFLHFHRHLHHFQQYLPCMFHHHRRRRTKFQKLFRLSRKIPLRHFRQPSCFPVHLFQLHHHRHHHHHLDTEHLQHYPQQTLHHCFQNLYLANLNRARFRPRMNWCLHAPHLLHFQCQKCHQLFLYFHHGRRPPHTVHQKNLFHRRWLLLPVKLQRSQRVLR